jgi:transcriptional regulator with GAF, ATPase, and Fis domain
VGKLTTNHHVPLRVSKEDEDGARITAVLEQHRWNRSKAAEYLGIPGHVFSETGKNGAD